MKPKWETAKEEYDNILPILFRMVADAYDDYDDDCKGFCDYVSAVLQVQINLYDYFFEE